MSPTAPKAPPPQPTVPALQNPSLIAAEEALKTGHLPLLARAFEKPFSLATRHTAKALLWRLSPTRLSPFPIAGCLIFAYVAFTTQH